MIDDVVEVEVSHEISEIAEAGAGAGAEIEAEAETEIEIVAAEVAVADDMTEDFPYDSLIIELDETNVVSSAVN
jgi:hypothetical protein